MSIWKGISHDLGDEHSSMTYDLRIWGDDSPKPMFLWRNDNKGVFNKRELRLALSELVYECVSFLNFWRKIYHKSHEVDNLNASIGIKRFSISEWKQCPILQKKGFHMYLQVSLLRFSYRIWQCDIH